VATSPAQPKPNAHKWPSRPLPRPSVVAADKGAAFTTTHHRMRWSNVGMAAWKSSTQLMINSLPPGVTNSASDRNNETALPKGPDRDRRADPEPSSCTLASWYLRPSTCPYKIVMVYKDSNSSRLRARTSTAANPKSAPKSTIPTFENPALYARCWIGSGRRYHRLVEFLSSCADFRIRCHGDFDGRQR